MKQCNSTISIIHVNIHTICKCKPLRYISMLCMDDVFKIVYVYIKYIVQNQFYNVLFKTLRELRIWNTEYFNKYHEFMLFGYIYVCR